MSLKPDTIAVRILSETELDADSADLTVVIEGSTVFSGAEAFKKAKELRELIEALRATGIEEGRIFHSDKISGRQFAFGMQSDLVQHPGEIDQALRFLIIRAGSLSMHCSETSRLVLECQQTTCALRTRPLH